MILIDTVIRKKGGKESKNATEPLSFLHWYFRPVARLEQLGGRGGGGGVANKATPPGHKKTPDKNSKTPVDLGSFILFIND